MQSTKTLPEFITIVELDIKALSETTHHLNMKQRSKVCMKLFKLGQTEPSP